MATVSDLNDFLDMSVEQLKYYLQQRGQTYSGTHASLAARALLAQEQGISIVPIADDIAKQLKSDYNAILSNHQLITDPFMESGWVDDVTLFPLTNIGQVFSYILSAKAFSTEYIGQYKVRIIVSKNSCSEVRDFSDMVFISLGDVKSDPVFFEPLQ